MTDEQLMEIEFEIDLTDEELDELERMIANDPR